MDLFDRDSPDDRYLSKHDFLGRAIFRLSDLLATPRLRLDIPLLAARDVLLPSSTSVSLISDSNDGEWLPRLDDESFLSHNDYPLPPITSQLSGQMPPPATDLRRATMTSRAAKKVRGVLSVCAERLAPDTVTPSVVFRVQAAMLRDSCILGRSVTQFYEILREREEEGGTSSWSCVFRSHDGVMVDKNNYVQFEDVSLSELQLHNMNPMRRLRFAFYKRHTRQQHELISFVSTSLHHLKSDRFKKGEAAIPMEGIYGDDDGLGNVLVKHVDSFHFKSPCSKEETRFSSLVVQLRADHFLHKKFTSSLNDSRGHARRLRQLPNFVTLH